LLRLTYIAPKFLQQHIGSLITRASQSLEEHANGWERSLRVDALTVHDLLTLLTKLPSDCMSLLTVTKAAGVR
jgi:hypothetical protein